MKKPSISFITVVLIGGLVGCVQRAEYSLSIFTTEGGEITPPGDGSFAYDEGTMVSLVTFPHTGYRFVNWTHDVSTAANVSGTMTDITMSSNYTVTANFAVDPYSQTDAYLVSNGPATLPAEEQNSCPALGTVTSIIIDSVRVTLPDSRFIVVPRYSDVFGPGANQTTVLRFAACVPGMPIAGGVYIFTGLDMAE